MQMTSSKGGGCEKDGEDGATWEGQQEKAAQRREEWRKDRSEGCMKNEGKVRKERWMLWFGKKE